MYAWPAANRSRTVAEQRAANLDSFQMPNYDRSPAEQDGQLAAAETMVLGIEVQIDRAAADLQAWQQLLQQTEQEFAAVQARLTDNQDGTAAAAQYLEDLRASKLAWERRVGAIQYAIEYYARAGSGEA